jgi:archaellum component FlaF (FlaF/FlaG flagellin family)
MRKCLIAVVIIFVVAPAFAQKLAVKIIDRQNNDTEYTYIVGGYSSSTSNTDVNCYGNGSNVNCNGSTMTTGVSTPARQGSYRVRGATFSLQLPDGRVAVVNCEGKYRLRFDHVNTRSCRIPLVDDIQAEFVGGKAKLKWSVSLDGKTMESETYKILAVLAK